MKGRKKGRSLPLTCILLFVCITGRATTDLDDSEEEDVLGKRFQNWHTKLAETTKTNMLKCTVDVILYLWFFFWETLESGTKLKMPWFLTNREMLRILP